VKVQIRRVPAAQIPKEPAARAAWLDNEWAKMDAWVDAILADRPEEIAADISEAAPAPEGALGAE
jgi:hypothetical protein